MTLQEFRSDLHRALWIQGIGIVAGAGGSIALAVAAIVETGP